MKKTFLMTFLFAICNHISFAQKETTVVTLQNDEKAPIINKHISTHFEAMGKILAEMVINGKNEQIENKSSLIIRNSL